MFNSHPGARNLSIRRFFVRGQVRPAWLLLGLLGGDSAQHQALEAHILIQKAVAWEAIVLLIRHGLVVPTAFIGGTQKRNRAVRPDQQQILDCMLLFLAAVVEALFINVSWSIYGSFGPIMEKRAGSCDIASACPIVAARDGNAPAVARASLSTAWSK